MLVHRHIYVAKNALWFVYVGCPSENKKCPLIHPTTSKLDFECLLVNLMSDESWKNWDKFIEITERLPHSTLMFCGSYHCGCHQLVLQGHLNRVNYVHNINLATKKRALQYAIENIR